MAAMRYAVVVVLVGCGAVDATRDPVAPLVELTVTRTGAAVGYVQSVEQPGIVCGTQCSARFPSGSTVTLWEAVDHDSVFGGWSGPCSGTDDCTLVIDGAESVSAAFTCTGTRQFDYTGKIETFTVPSCASSIVIDAYGAQGGNAGGRGARIRGTFTGTGIAGLQLAVLVGASGRLPGTFGQSSAGGGGSFVFADANDAVPLIAAAGGGCAMTGCSGGPGSETPTPTQGIGGTGNGPGGSNGSGGTGGRNLRAGALGSTGGGGAGWVSDGLPGSTGSVGDGGSAPRNGGRRSPFVDEGFGGGGGGSCGGGGGFNGGGGGNNRDGALGCGGGGGSYNGGADPIGFPGTREGNGQVTISWSE
jgi:hypothetical protein